MYESASQRRGCCARAWGADAGAGRQERSGCSTGCMLAPGGGCAACTQCDRTRCNPQGLCCSLGAPPPSCPGVVHRLHLNNKPPALFLGAVANRRGWAATAVEINSEAGERLCRAGFGGEYVADSAFAAERGQRHAPGQELRCRLSHHPPAFTVHALVCGGRVQAGGTGVSSSQGCHNKAGEQGVPCSHWWGV
jgi:hypothetical protein